MIGESSLKEGTVIPDKNNTLESPLSEQFFMKQNSLDVNQNYNEKRNFSRENSADNKNFLHLAATNEKNKERRQVRFTSFENEDEKRKKSTFENQDFSLKQQDSQEPSDEFKIIQ